MTTNQIKKEVIHILQNMGIPQKAIKEEASFQKDLGLDSLDFAELVLELERNLRLDIPILEIEGVQTIGDTIHYLATKSPCLKSE